MYDRDRYLISWREKNVVYLAPCIHKLLQVLNSSVLHKSTNDLLSNSQYSFQFHLPFTNLRLCIIITQMRIDLSYTFGLVLVSFGVQTWRCSHAQVVDVVSPSHLFYSHQVTFKANLDINFNHSGDSIAVNSVLVANEFTESMPA